MTVRERGDSELKTPAQLRREARRERLERFFGAPAAVLLSLVLFVLVNHLSARHYTRFDWTRAGLFTLSPRSRQIVRSLQAPTDLYVLLGPREPQYADVSELAQRYAAEGPLLRVHTIDPDAQRDRFLDLVQRLGIRPGRTNSSDVASEAAVLVVRGDRHWEIARERLVGLGDDVALDEGAGTRVAQARVTVERAISEALARVERNDAAVVCAATGHGEIPLQGGDDSMSMLATELSHQNVTTRAVDVRGTNAVPADCDALLVAGPRQAFSPNDAEIIERYLRGGGNVLLLLDPFFVERRHAPTGLEGIARLGGIELTRTVVIESDPAHLLADNLPVTFTAGEFGESELTRGLRGTELQVLVRTARGLRRAAGAAVVPTSLLRTGPTAWGEISTADAVREGGLHRDPEDLPGPIELAMSSQVPEVQAQAPRQGRTREAAGRMVVVGYSHLVTNEALTLGFQARFANANLINAAIGWLTARRELIEIPARPVSATALNVTQRDARMIFLYAVVAVPAAAALLGVWAWLSRRGS